MRDLKANPDQAIPYLGGLLRSTLLDIWQSRGGGLYGLGYLVAFGYFQVNLFLEDLMESASVSEFALGQLLEYLIRFGFLSFINAFQALLWPVYILQYFEGVGILLLAVAYFGFEYALKPFIERQFPELRS